MKTLRLILGDQLNAEHSWFGEKDDAIIYAMFEMRQETDYVKHHIQKVIGFFAAMRDFADQLEQDGHRVVYYRINDENNTQSLSGNIQQLIKEFKIEKFEYLLPDEYRLDQELTALCRKLDISGDCVDSEHFYTSRTELSNFFEGKKQYLMESFYRYMRKKHQILMTGSQPEGGKWNFDQSNRKKWTGNPSIPPALIFRNDVDEIVADIEKSGIKTMGRLKGGSFPYPINRQQAIEQLHPQVVVNKVLAHYRQNSHQIDISQVEGFIRQIIGWREYMRGIYWKEMPSYGERNALDNHQPLPDFYWTGQTKMNCLSKAINNSLDNAYAHHIQRLMITGNFALLAHIHPDEVSRWYLGVYIDAIQWVEITNTRGMSQYADGGIIATKPYVSSASYINKMGNYCTECHYSKNERTGENACPFNSLYWNFLDSKKDKLRNNRRMGMMYNLLAKIPETEMDRIRERAQQVIANPDEF